MQKGLNFLGIGMILCLLLGFMQPESWFSNRTIKGKRLHLRNIRIDGTQDTTSRDGFVLTQRNGTLVLEDFGIDTATYNTADSNKYVFVGADGLPTVNNVLQIGPGQFSNEFGVFINDSIMNGLVTEGDFRVSSYEGGSEFNTVRYGATMAMVPDGLNIWEFKDSSSAGANRGAALRFLSNSGDFETGNVGESLIGKDIARIEFREQGGDGRVAGHIRFRYLGKTTGGRAYGLMNFAMRDSSSASSGSDASVSLLELDSRGLKVSMPQLRTVTVAEIQANDVMLVINGELVKAPLDSLSAALNP